MDDDIKPGQATASRPITPLSPKGHRIGMMILGGLLFLSILVPFLFWQGTWFGRQLNDEQMQQYMQDNEQPRHIQHALAQISERIVAGDSSVTKWYPQVRQLAGNERPEVRATAAWVLGQDNSVPEFQETLRGLLDDAEPLVRRNAALSLVRFDDRSGRDEIAAMLEPYTYVSPLTGTVQLRLEPGDSVDRATLLARVDTATDEAVEVRSPLPGTVRQWLAEDDTKIIAGQPLVVLSPSDDQAWGALRALFLIGDTRDLSLVNRIARGAYDLSNRTRQQAALTADAIQERITNGGGTEKRQD